MSTPYNQSLPMTDPLGNPIRRGHTETMVDAMGNPVPYSKQEMPVAGGGPVPHHPSGGYLIPPGLARQAQEEAVKQPEPTVVDQIADDVSIPDYPPGSPELVPLYKLSFAKRADSMDAFARLNKMDVNTEPGKTPTLEDGAKLYRALAEIDNFLATVAVNPDEYHQWITGPGLDPGVFSQLWSAYQARMQPGEASSSSS